MKSTFTTFLNTAILAMFICGCAPSKNARDPDEKYLDKIITHKVTSEIDIEKTKDMFQLDIQEFEKKPPQ